MTVSVNVDDSEVRQAFNRMNRTLSNMRPAMELVGYAVEQLILQGFITSTDPYGKAWAKPPAHRKIGKKLITAKARPDLAKSWLPLRDKGRLMGSITHIADKNSVKVGTNVAYAFNHQEGVGTNLLGGKIRQRKFLPDLGLPVLWSNEVLRTVEDYLDEALNGNN